MAVGRLDAQQHDAIGWQAEPNHKLAEVLVLGHQNALFRGHLAEYGNVIQAARRFHHVPNVVPVLSQAGHEQGVAAFVCGEFHGLLPDAGTISSAAKWSAAKAAAARMSSTVRCG